MNECINNIITQTQAECKYTKVYKTHQINFIEPSIIVTWIYPKTKITQDCNKNNIQIQGKNLIKIYDCSIEINDIKIVNTLSDYTQNIYVTNNKTKIEPISYLQTKQIVLENTKYNKVFNIITSTTFVITLLGIILFTIVKLKLIPKRITIRHEATIKSKNSTPEEQLPAENIPLGQLESTPQQLYPIFPA